MTASLRDPAVLTALKPGEGLHFERTDIWFYDVAPDRVGVNVTVRNLGAEASRPARLLVDAAPLGVFLRWRPVATLEVPSLRPGEATDVSTEVARPRPEPLGEFAEVPPSRLLAASGAEDRAGAPGLRAGFLGGWSLRRRVRRAAEGRPAIAPSLPPDLMELLGRRNPHWAGNLNVFIGRRSVERHLARALRVYPGRTNLAAFIVGTGPDAYAFSLKGEGAAWDAALYDMTFRRSLLVDVHSDAPLRQSEWVPTRGAHLMMLAVCPPEQCQRGTLEVHVTQRSTRKTAVVEFSLDPAAEGPGCYAV